MNAFWAKLSTYFVRGLITLLPLLVTIWLLWFMFSFLDGILGNIITLFIGHPLPGVGFIITIALIFIAGYFGTQLFGVRLFKFGETLLSRVPIVKSIYSATKQVNDVLFQEKSADEYRRACIVEYPRKGIWSLGFVTSDAAAEIEAKAKEKMINIFIANTPTPATGFLIMVPAREVILLDMKIEDAIKYLISAGVLKPATIPQEVPIKKES
ncbi:MAG: DUF502 domain-containing protein [Candidatus Margulisbacteria bacterium]|jgi:uncharacterized membrane protein|nr:DUF502 domain-containing protein [Candidatus Margulisiibacteriota bacterium]